MWTQKMVPLEVVWPVKRLFFYSNHPQDLVVAASTAVCLITAMQVQSQKAKIFQIGKRNIINQRIMALSVLLYNTSINRGLLVKVFGLTAESQRQIKTLCALGAWR